MPSTTIACQVWLSQTAQKTASSVLIQSQNLTLGGGKGTDSATFSYTIPSNISGNYFIIADVDTANAVVETSDLDNTSTASIAISSPVITGLDLGIDITGYEWLSDGRVRISYAFTNLGTEAITSSKSTAGFVGGFATTWNRTDKIAPNQTARMSSVYPTSLLPATFPATFKITILQVNGRADAPNKNEASILVLK